MPEGYFHRVNKETSTRFWVNNSTLKEVDLGLEAGAVCCTTNPQYIQKLIPQVPDYVHKCMDEVIRATDDDNVAAERVYHKAAGDVMARFLPLYKKSNGQLGLVTIQGDPRADEDPEKIIAEALRATKLGPNFMAKIPVTEAGIAAIEDLVRRNVPICATEIFTLAQTIEMCEVFAKASKKSGNKPPFFVTHITGIMDQWWGEMVKAEKIDIAPEVLKEAGPAIARKEYRLMKERKYPGIMLGGGARGLHHFTEFVGGDLHITINWSTARELIDLNGPVVSRVDAFPPREYIQELEAKLPGFRRAWHEDGLPARHFKDYGPVVFFRNNFVSGYVRLMEEIATRRAVRK